MAEAIARNLYEMAGLRVPLLTTITGEGGSGGALALAVSDRIYMLENAIFSVISPEGCASILFKDAAQAPKAAESLKLDAEGISSLGLVDAVIREPDEITLDPTSTFEAVRVRLAADLAELRKMSVEDLLASRYRKFRTMGQVEREPEEEQIAEEKALHAVYNR
jgi:acetyl-CoA carboxylase carboxyl transferase subunit alpha